MKISKEIYHKKKLNLDGKIITRDAVRGIILQENKILMIFSTENTDYKFPGGGIETEETHKEALKREIKEECGALVTNINEKVGKVIEYNKPIEKDYDLFKMTSHYYICGVEENSFDLSLDKYEEELGFKPVWVKIDTAIKNNKSLLNSTTKKAPRWTKRDTFVLEEIFNDLYHRNI